MTACASAGAKQPIFGTNPICMSVPAAGGPVTMDMATAAYAWFGVLEAKTAGRPLPEGVAQDPQGRDTTDPEAVLSGGALKVFDGSHKGSALALFVELLAGPLVGAAVADKLEEKNWGNLIVAIDPSLLQVRFPMPDFAVSICFVACCSCCFVWQSVSSYAVMLKAVWFAGSRHFCCQGTGSFGSC